MSIEPISQLRMSSKLPTISWPAIVDRSRPFSSVCLRRDEKACKLKISKNFMQPFRECDNERTKVRRSGGSIKSLLRFIEYYIQLGNPVIKFRLTRKFHKKLLYELYHYSDTQDCTPLNIRHFEKMLSTALGSRSSTFQSTFVLFSQYVKDLPNSPRTATLCFQVFTSIAILLDSIDHMIGFCSNYAKTQEDLEYITDKVLSEDHLYKQFFNSKLKPVVPHGITIYEDRLNLPRPILECKVELDNTN